jgi:acylphosphatase
MHNRRSCRVGSSWTAGFKASVSGSIAPVERAQSADGRVEILLQGPPESVAQVERWCAFGPQLAEVTSVEVTDEPHAREYGFAIR